MHRNGNLHFTMHSSLMTSCHMLPLLIAQVGSNVKMQFPQCTASNDSPFLNVSYFLKFFPAVGAPYDQMIESGYEAMMKWDGNMLNKVGLRQPNYQALYVLWFLKALEVIVFEGFALLHSVLLKILSIFIFKRPSSSLKSANLT